jgi:putative ABC transport system ATP-binding protein
MLSIKNLYKSFGQPGGEVCVLGSLSFEMQPASSVALLGESGSGKSTLLHLIAGLDKAQSGEIEFAGQLLNTLNESSLANIRRHQISLVFQQFHL